MPLLRQVVIAAAVLLIIIIPGTTGQEAAIWDADVTECCANDRCFNAYCREPLAQVWVSCSSTENHGRVRVQQRGGTKTFNSCQDRGTFPVLCCSSPYCGECDSLSTTNSVDGCSSDTPFFYPTRTFEEDTGNCQVRPGTDITCCNHPNCEGGCSGSVSRPEDCPQTRSFAYDVTAQTCTATITSDDGILCCTHPDCLTGCELYPTIDWCPNELPYALAENTCVASAPYICNDNLVPVTDGGVFVPDCSCDEDRFVNTCRKSNSASACSGSNSVFQDGECLALTEGACCSGEDCTGCSQFPFDLEEWDPSSNFVRCGEGGIDGFKSALIRESGQCITPLVTCCQDALCTDCRDAKRYNRCQPDEYPYTKERDGTCSITRTTCDNSPCSASATCQDDDSEESGVICTCQDGFRGDGYSCFDNNECNNDPPLCDINAACTNLPGSFRCTCNEGFIGNGFSCAATGGDGGGGDGGDGDGGGGDGDGGDGNGGGDGGDGDGGGDGNNGGGDGDGGDGDGKSGAGMGDPHFMTWGGRSWYDFHGICDLVFLHAPDFFHGLGMFIHIRTKRRYKYSFIESAVIQIGQDFLEIGSWGQYFLNGVEGALLPNIMGRGRFRVAHIKKEAKSHKFVILLDSNEENGEAVVITTLKDMVGVHIENGKAENFATSGGLMGSYADGSLVARDGSTVMTDHDAFGQEWQVLEGEAQLFQSPPLVKSRECLPPTVAEGRRRLGESLAMKDAEVACKRSLGKNDSDKQMEMCIMDVMAMEDLEVAEAHGFAR